MREGYIILPRVPYILGAPRGITPCLCYLWIKYCSLYHCISFCLYCENKNNQITSNSVSYLSVKVKEQTHRLKINIFFYVSTVYVHSFICIYCKAINLKLRTNSLILFISTTLATYYLFIFLTVKWSLSSHKICSGTSNNYLNICNLLFCCPSKTKFWLIFIQKHTFFKIIRF